MATTTPNMLLTKPDPDGSVGTWDTELNASLDVLDAHDHSAGKGVLIPVSALNINSDLPLANFALTQVKALAMAAVASSTVAALSRALFVNSADNELYWKTSGGVLVQLTSGTSLNAALLGGFTGDYGTGGSTVSFTSGTSIYNFLRAANHRAFIDSSDIRLFQGTVGITNAVKIRSPNALAASYDFIFPTALPAGQSLVQLSSGGQVIASNTVPASITMALDQHVTVSGTGRLKHGTRTKILNGGDCFGEGTTGSTEATISLDNINDRAFYGVPCEVGQRLLTIRAQVVDTAVGPTTITAALFEATGGTISAVAGATATSSGSGGVQTLTISGINLTLAAATRYVLRCIVSAANACSIRRVEFDYDEP